MELKVIMAQRLQHPSDEVTVQFLQLVLKVGLHQLLLADIAALSQGVLAESRELLVVAEQSLVAVAEELLE